MSSIMNTAMKAAVEPPYPYHGYSRVLVVGWAVIADRETRVLTSDSPLLKTGQYVNRQTHLPRAAVVFPLSAVGWIASFIGGYIRARMSLI